MSKFRFFQFKISNLIIIINVIQIMLNGVVKWFNTTKGYGFINQADTGKDVFVHISAVEEAGLKSLNEGDKVSFEVKNEKGKTSAVNLKKI